MGFKLKLHTGFYIWFLVFSSWRNCLAAEQNRAEASFLGATLAFFILMVLCAGIYFVLRIHSLFKGGELSSAWVFSGVALLILWMSAFIELLSSLGAVSNLSSLAFLFQLLGFSFLVFGFVLIKKKLS